MSTEATVQVAAMVGIAAAGGFVLNMMNLWEESRRPKNTRVPKDALYWLFFAFWPAAGGGLAWLYFLDGSSLRPLLAFSIGLSAPTTLQAMIRKATTHEGLPVRAEGNDIEPASASEQ